MTPSHRRHNTMWPRRRYCARAVSVLSLILKDLYPMHTLAGGPVYARPWWAKLAYARNWIDADAYYDIDEEPTGEVKPRMSGLLYAESPFFGLIKRDTSWSIDT